MRKPLITLALTLLSTAAFASAKCEPHPNSEWIPENQVKARLTAQGYKMRIFKVEGDCYEIYGTDKDGRKVEIYFDTKTLAVVKSEIRD